MYRKNTAGQFVYFCLVNATTGAALTGATVTAYRALDNGSQATATGTTTELGNGQYRFALSQADTNADYGSYLFTATNAVPVEKTVVFTGADPTDAAAFGLTRIDAAITSRLAAASLNTSAGGVFVAGDMFGNNLVIPALATQTTSLAIKAKTDQLAFTVANQVDANSLTGGLTQAQIRTAVGLSSANLDTQLGAIDDYLDTEIAAIKAKTDLITSGNISVLQDRVNDNTITMQYNENTSATVNLDEDTTSATLQFVVARPDGTDVLIIANGSITRTSADFTVTITTAVTATIGQYLWSLRDLSAGGNRVITKGVLTVQNAASIDA